MGYHLTNSLARSSSRSHASPKTHVPGSRLQERGHRFYSTELSRWINRDPIEEEGGLNLYCACRNDFINGVDPQGELFWTLLACGVIGTGFFAYEWIDLWRHNEAVIAAQREMIQHDTEVEDVEKYRRLLQNQLHEIHGFTYSQAMDQYVGSILLDGPVGDIAAEGIEASVSAFKVYSVVKATDKVKDATVTLKVGREFMEALGYRWVRSPGRATGGYWRKPPHSRMNSAATVNRIVEDAVKESLDGL